MKFICNKCGHDKLLVTLYKTNEDDGKSYLSEIKLRCEKCNDNVKRSK